MKILSATTLLSLSFLITTHAQAETLNNDADVQTNTSSKANNTQVKASSKDSSDQDPILNSEASGIFVSGALGFTQNQAVKNNNQVDDYDFSTKYSFGGTATVGYKFAFGQQGYWSSFYTGASANYYNFGSTINPIDSTVNVNGSGDVTSTDTTDMILQAVGAEFFVGTYLGSPFSLEAGVGIGTNISSPNLGIMGLFRFSIGYDIMENMRVFVQYIGAGFQDGRWNPIFFASPIDYKHSGVTANMEQIGISYTF